MKNQVLFIIDSLNYEHVKHSKINLMPFLSELEKKGISCSNMYSQAPYTEAAVMNIYCGQNVLDNDGYLLRFKNAPLTIFEAMKNKNFKTFYNSFQPQCYPSSLRRGVDHIYYNVGYDQAALWSYRLKHYSEVYKNSALSEKDYNDLEDILTDNFNEWLTFIKCFEENDESVNMIKSNASDYNTVMIKGLVQSEYDLFQENSINYINELLETGYDHRFFKIPSYRQNNKVKDKKVKTDVQDMYRPLLKKIRKLNMKLNFKNALFKILKAPIHKLIVFIKHPNKLNLKEFAKSVYLSFNYLFDLDLNDRISDSYDSFKNAPSARTHIQHYVNWAKQHANDGKHFACIHVDDIHNPEIFFTYDSDDKALLSKELKDAYNLLNEIPSDYYGSITHDLSLRYIDGVIKYFYTELEHNGLLEDTCITICADHGFSFSGNPIRDSFVINLYLENYNIPFVITGCDKVERIEKLCSSKDIPETICDLADGEIPEEFTGKSVLRENNSTLCIEYCGGGCPDIRRRMLKIAAYNEHYFVGTLATIDDKLLDHVTEIYNLKDDPKQEKNLIRHLYDDSEVNSLIQVIENRRMEIRKQL